MEKHNFRNDFKNGLKTFLILLTAVTLSFLLIIITHNRLNSLILYFLTIILIAKVTDGYFWGILSSVLGGAAVNYYFNYPSFLQFNRYGYPLTLTGLLSISVIISTTISHLKDFTKRAEEREAKSNRLNEINNRLFSTNDLTGIIEVALEYIGEFTGTTVVYYEESPQLGSKCYMSSLKPEHEKIIHSHHEEFIANWVFQNKSPAGIGTDFPGVSSCTYLPLLSHNTIWGVMGIFRTGQEKFKQINISSLNLIIKQVALAIERQHLSDNQQLIQIENEKEKTRANLLRAVSHDLRTPLTGMIGASETILNNKNILSEKEQIKLIEYIYEDSNWLLHMVENLLSVTRIREGNSSVNKVPEPLEEVITEAIMRTRKRFPYANIKVNIPDDFIMVPMDATLIEQVIINLLENAIKYSGNNKPVILLVEKDDSDITFHIKDEGKGISVSKIDSIFDGCSQTENLSSDSAKGLGIGLSICKTIINAHGGTITAKNNDGQGAVFTFTLPLEGSLIK
ncbi:ATP-binding protein [Anaerocolumna sp. MB42-C2]|uniref:ATP-binding protein n=1 Tax=Anaerocolumna sp. MB42-C2 TaxID=3070997 RepID=UPI0027E0CA4C|nr:ATP-binding protein [Anaerocolumna sp. MB42-C2]WMJ90074.1 ATP-binding protein [Anaerocolumna sp. MB42-C2]